MGSPHQPVLFLAVPEEEGGPGLCFWGNVQSYRMEGGVTSKRGEVDGRTGEFSRGRKKKKKKNGGWCLLWDGNPNQKQKKMKQCAIAHLVFLWLGREFSGTFSSL